MEKKKTKLTISGKPRKNLYDNQGLTNNKKKQKFVTEKKFSKPGDPLGLVPIKGAFARSGPRGCSADGKRTRLACLVETSRVRVPASSK